NGGLLIRMSQVQVLQGEPIKESRIIDAAFLHLKILAYLPPPLTFLIAHSVKKLSVLIFL
ncbi:hypothetical protein, partial [Vibrio atlanticus]|uniref:hypothetical protein n=1 Tax=Vibrio atlanticus TaxID=693153 RepID=UPI0035507D8E